MNESDILSGGKVADLLNISNQAMASLIKRKRISATRIRHNRYDITRQDLLAYIDLRLSELKADIHKLNSVKKYIQ